MKSNLVDSATHLPNGNRLQAYGKVRLLNTGRHWKFRYVNGLLL